MKKIFLLLLLPLLADCASTPSIPFHTILGSIVGFNTNVEIIRDIRISGLRIRHVRRPNTTCTQGTSDLLEIQGTIGPDSTAALERLLPLLAKCTTASGTTIVNAIYLDSDGGLLADGLALGNLFRRYSIITSVATGQTCASSCAIAFLGGDFRSINGGTLMFHAPYLKQMYGIRCVTTGDTARNLNNYYTQMIGATAGKFLFERTNAYCSQSEGWAINSDAADLFGITNL
jgi:hypothetical protein